MPAKKYHVTLTAEEHMSLEQMLRRGKHSTRRFTRGRILLKAADGLRDDEMAAAVETSMPTVERTRKRFAEHRLQALDERPRPGKKPVLAERGEARWIAAACTPAPEGRERWTLQWLADRVVALQLAVSCSKDTVWRVRKKTPCSRG